MKLADCDFTCLAAAKRLFPLATVDPDSVEGRYCAVRNCSPQTPSAGTQRNPRGSVRLFADLQVAKEWVQNCPCLAATPQDHFVRTIVPLEPPESAAFRDAEDWTIHHAAELLQKWAVLAERLAKGPASRNELKQVLADAVSHGEAAWVSADSTADPVDCLPTLCWAHWHKMVKVEYRPDLTTIEFSL